MSRFFRKFVFVLLLVFGGLTLLGCAKTTSVVFEAEQADLGGSAAVQHLSGQVELPAEGTEGRELFVPSNDYSVGNIIGADGTGQVTFTGTVTFNITSNKGGKAVLYATVSGFLIPFVDGYNVYTHEEFTVEVNGTAVAFEDIDLSAYEETGLPFMGGFATVTQWVEVNLGTITLNEGENTIVITGVTSAPNLDCIRVESKLDLSWEPNTVE